LYLTGIDICCLLVLNEDQHHTLKSLVGPVEEFLMVVTLCSVFSDDIEAVVNELWTWIYCC